MLVYHTSYTVVDKPNVSFSRKYLDFGQGFYVTTLREQAVKYASRMKARHGVAYLNTYQFDDASSKATHKRFPEYNGEWLDYVAACRDGREVEQYDVIEGGIADDKVFDTVDLYFSGRMSKEDALRQLMYVKPNWQICIASQDVIDQYLHFISSEIIE